jgi:hypothetical protein
MDYFLGLLILHNDKPSAGVDSNSTVAIDSFSVVIECNNEAKHISLRN